MAKLPEAEDALGRVSPPGASSWDGDTAECRAGFAAPNSRVVQVFAINCITLVARFDV